MRACACVFWAAAAFPGAFALRGVFSLTLCVSDGDLIMCPHREELWMSGTNVPVQQNTCVFFLNEAPNLKGKA